MLGLIQDIRTNDLSPDTPDHSGAKLLDHPGIRMLFRDRIRSIKPERTRWFESMARIVLWMTKDKHKFNSCI